MKVSIIGGGLAGWIAAIVLQRETSYKITVIDSSSIGSLGVGESTTGRFSGFIRKYFKEEEFVEQCAAIPKLGIRFINWNKDNFISPIEGSFSAHDEFDYSFYYGVENNNVNDYSTHALLSDRNLIDFSKKTTKNTFLSAESHAYHLDTYKTISFLKQRGIGDGIEFIDAKVIGNEKKGGKVTKIKCEGMDIDCDFVVDCSGFKRVIASTYNPHFISYEKWLSVNTGLSFNLTWDDIEYTQPLTTAHALSCGWMWMIPNHYSIGCGIVYDNNFASQDEIIKEVNDILGVEISIRKEIKFKSGRLRKSLYNNVAVIGPAYSFLEPLQATSIHVTITQIEKLISFLSGYMSERLYNRYCGDMVDNYADFISLHYQFKYHQNEFWQSRVPRRYTSKMINRSKKKVLKTSDYTIKNPDCTANNLWSYVLDGGNLITKSKATYSEEQISNIKYWEKQIQESVEASMSFSSFLEMYNKVDVDVELSA